MDTQHRLQADRLRIIVTIRILYDVCFDVYNACVLSLRRVNVHPWRESWKLESGRERRLQDKEGGAKKKQWRGKTSKLSGGRRT